MVVFMKVPKAGKGMKGLSQGSMMNNLDNCIKEGVPLVCHIY